MIWCWSGFHSAQRHSVTAIPLPTPESKSINTSHANCRSPCCHCNHISCVFSSSVEGDRPSKEFSPSRTAWTKDFLQVLLFHYYTTQSSLSFVCFSFLKLTNLTECSLLVVIGAVLVAIMHHYRSDSTNILRFSQHVPLV